MCNYAFPSLFQNDISQALLGGMILITGQNRKKKPLIALNVLLQILLSCQLLSKSKAGIEAETSEN